MSDTSRQTRARAAAAARRFGVVAAGLLAISAIVIVALARFDFLGAGFHVNLAMALGAAGTIAVGVGLMALTFYSSRSGSDDEIAPTRADPDFDERRSQQD
ncbi:MAG: hypothetical protein U5J99_11825 [Parvularculaceae bacterium]|nr:hypothetical protein [Parvularculaceae bacterium]